MKVSVLKVWKSLAAEVANPGYIPWLVYLLGLLGWLLIARNYPFGWELPRYANF